MVKKQHKKHETHEHKESKPSRLGALFGRVSGFLKETVAAPPEQKAEPIQDLSPEAFEEKYEEKMMEEQKAPEQESDDEPEQQLVTMRNDKLRDEVLGSLNNAVQKWKETGDLGVKLEPPVRLRERVQRFVQRIKNSNISTRLKKQLDEMFEKVKRRAKKAEDQGQKVNTDQIVKEEWAEVLKRVEKSGSKDEREEIEKIYKELEGK